MGFAGGEGEQSQSLLARTDQLTLRERRRRGRMRETPAFASEGRRRWPPSPNPSLRGLWSLPGRSLLGEEGGMCGGKEQVDREGGEIEDNVPNQIRRVL